MKAIIITLPLPVPVSLQTFVITSVCPYMSHWKNYSLLLFLQKPFLPWIMAFVYTWAPSEMENPKLHIVLENQDCVVDLCCCWSVLSLFFWDLSFWVALTNLGPSKGYLNVELSFPYVLYFAVLNFVWHFVIVCQDICYAFAIGFWFFSVLNQLVSSEKLFLIHRVPESPLNAVNTNLCGDSWSMWSWTSTISCYTWTWNFLPHLAAEVVVVEQMCGFDICWLYFF